MKNNFYAKDGSIFLAASKRLFTDLIELSNFSFSSSDKFNSIIFSTPPAPIITGTPAYKFFVPYSPFK